jgi:hypothetical protein
MCGPSMHPTEGRQSNKRGQGHRRSRQDAPLIHYTVKKKVRKFPVPSRDVTTKLSLGGNNDVITELFLPRGSLVSDIPAGDGKLVNLFLRCRCWRPTELVPCLTRSMVGTHRSGARYPRDALFKGRNIQEFSVGDTSVGDT